MQPIHLVIGAIEGVITGTVLSFIYETRPELLWNPNNSEKDDRNIVVLHRYGNWFVYGS